MAHVADEIEEFERRPVPPDPYFPGSSDPGARQSWVRRNVTVFTAISALFTLWYSWLVYDSVRPFWFHPAWTTDDALQQIFPFHEVNQPGVFKGDLITEVMSGYLAPAHYWLSYGVTYLTGDPIMMGHWVMLIQVVLTLGFLFAAVRHAAGNVPALLSVAWLLHSRNVMQRLTCGLVRGWSAPLFAAFFFFALRGNHLGVLATLLFGCVLNPPAALVVGVAYGIVLAWRLVSTSGRERQRITRNCLSYLAAAPVFALITLAVIHRPEPVGQMVTYEEASQMPEFQEPDGRFPFVPFKPVAAEMRMFGLQAFVGRFYEPPPAVRVAMPYVVVGLLAAIVAIGALRKRWLPVEVIAFGVAALSVYAASRMFAFKLYVPNRHLQIPMAFFLITAYSIGAWRAFHRGKVGYEADARLKSSWVSVLALCLVGWLVWQGSRDGLSGTANFNYAVDKRGKVFSWLKKNSPVDSLIAGHPTHIDPTQLFAARRAYVTTETTHPFYKGYYAEMKRRNEVSLRAHYSASLNELYSILAPEGIDYFVFKRSDFYPNALSKVRFFPPLDAMVKELVSRPPNEYAYRQLPGEVDVDKYPFMPFKDQQSVLVDVNALGQYLKAQGQTL